MSPRDLRCVRAFVETGERPYFQRSATGRHGRAAAGGKSVRIRWLSASSSPKSLQTKRSVRQPAVQSTPCARWGQPGTFRAAGCVCFRPGTFDAVGDRIPDPLCAGCPRPGDSAPPRAGCPRRELPTRGSEPGLGSGFGNEGASSRSRGGLVVLASGRNTRDQTSLLVQRPRFLIGGGVQ